MQQAKQYALNSCLEPNQANAPMTSQAATPNEYFEQLPEERKEAFNMLRLALTQNLPEGFAEVMQYGMISYVVPHTLYPAGYHCDPKTPLPFMALASQKNHIAIYHMGLYMSQELMDWFTTEFAKHTNTKLDIGKSCIRFKKPAEIPYRLIGELASKITVEHWIAKYESALKK
jgi:hypothetical protein